MTHSKRGIRNASEKLHEQACLYQIGHDEKDYAKACKAVLAKDRRLRKKYEEQSPIASSPGINDVSRRLTQAAKEIMQTRAVRDFAKACHQALEEDLALAREYVESGDVKLKALVNHETVVKTYTFDL